MLPGMPFKLAYIYIAANGYVLWGYELLNFERGILMRSS